MPAPNAAPDPVQCENCQTVSDTVTERQTTRTRQTLCASCYANHLQATDLSSRESEVYAYADSGFTNSEIATELGIDASTVSSHLARIRNKYQQAVTLTETLDPSVTTTLTKESWFEDTLPRNLTPGAVVELTHPLTSTDPRDPDWTHGIVRRALTRSQSGVPTRIAVYPFSPDTGTVRMHSHTGMPMVADTNAEVERVVFPTNTTLKNLD